jgi:MarR family protein
VQDFNYHTFHKRRRAIKITGLVLVIAGVFTIIDMSWKVPIPLTGVRALMVGLVLILFGSIALYNGYKLPVNEAIEIIHRRGAGVSASELIHEMRVDRATANRIIDALLRKGFLRSSSGARTAEEFYEIVR